MAVSGKKSFCEQGSEEFIEISCKPCEDDGKRTVASGLCLECEENMCKTCFGHHKKAKVCKDHKLIDCAEVTGVIGNKLSDGLEKCPEHLNGLIKFYCPVHDKVGCGDCMILEHKACKVDYIPSKAKEFKDSQVLDRIVKDISQSDTQIQQCLSAIQNNRSRAEEIHDKFIADAEAFKDEIFEHVNKLTNEICSKAVDMKSLSLTSIDELEKDATRVARKVSLMKEAFETQRNQPNKLFVTTIQRKQNITAFRQQIEGITNKNKIEEYIFQRHGELESAMTKCNVLGVIKRTPCDKDEDAKKDNILSLEVKQTERASNPLPLLDHTLRAEDILVDGDFLSFRGLQGISNGLYIGDNIMTEGSYFEVEIIKCGGSDASVGIGLVPKDYRSMCYPGWRKHSVGFHSDDGKVFIDSDHGKPFGPPSGEKDVMGCGVSSKALVHVNVFFTRNGKQIGEQTLFTKRSLYPAVALDTKGQKVKVTLAAKLPLQ